MDKDGSEVWYDSESESDDGQDDAAGDDNWSDADQEAISEDDFASEELATKGGLGGSSASGEQNSLKRKGVASAADSAKKMRGAVGKGGAHSSHGARQFYGALQLPTLPACLCLSSPPSLSARARGAPSCWVSHSYICVLAQHAM